MSIPVPRDYILRRDLCSYGYFLLAPNHWDPAAGVLSRVLELADGPTRLQIAQVADRPSRGGRAGGVAGVAGVAGRPLAVRADRALSAGERAQARGQLTRMLRLDEPAATIAEFHRADPRWRRSGRGRLMRSPTFFEDVIKTVTSCNITWPGTVSMNRRLCEVVGRAAPGGGRSFPTPARLARTRPGTLRARCRVGYRDQRIVQIAGLFASRKFDAPWFEDPSTGDGELWEALIDLPGVGPYAAANIMQLLGRYHRLPLDTESIRHARSVLGMAGTAGRIMARLHAHYAPFGRHAFRSYWLELWEFYESRRGPAWTWERETTGESFTAAKLKAPADGAPRR